MALCVYLVAGEASGDALGAGLMRALSARLGQDVTFFGVGGERMEAAGLSSLFPYHELSLMGFVEIVPHLFELMARMHQVVEHAVNKRPDVVMTIDSPGFNFRLVEKLRKEKGLEHTRFVHYVAPSVWAYKPRRAALCARLFHHVLALLPFEPPYFEREGLSVTFVGHPLAFVGRGDGEAFRARHGIAPGAPLVCLLPGSRKNEIKRHLAAMAGAVSRLGPLYPDIAMAVPVPQRLLPMAAMYFEGCPYRTVLLYEEEEKRNAMAAATCALVKSGTVSLEAAAMGCPQIVTYRAHPLTAALVRRMLRIPYVSIMNLLQKKEVIPELLQERCTADYLGNALENMLKNDAARARQREAFVQNLAALRGTAHPDDAAAEAVLRLVQR